MSPRDVMLGFPDGNLGMFLSYKLLLASVSHPFGNTTAIWTPTPWELGVGKSLFPAWASALLELTGKQRGNPPRAMT